MANGTVRDVFISQEKGTPMRRVPEATALSGRGLEGCRHAKRKPGGKRQILLMDVANLRALDLPAGALKENLGMTSGLINTARYVAQQAGEPATVAVIGAGEALNNLALAFLLIVLAAIAAAAGSLRVARSAPTYAPR